jgi:hypothetical protein
MAQRRNRFGRACAVAAVSMMLWAAPGRAEFWPTEYFLQQSNETQISFMSGLLDMYEYTRDEIAPDPDDWVKPCLRGFTIEELRQQFVDWLLNDPAGWRLTPATLLLEALADFCGQ